MTLIVEKHRDEWLVAEMLSVSVDIAVADGEVKQVLIHGLMTDTISTDLNKLKRLFHCTAEILEEVRAAQERTRPLEKVQE